MYVCLYSYSISCLIGTLARQLYAIVTAHPIAQNESGYCLPCLTCTARKVFLIKGALTIMSNMIESILVDKNNTDCTSFHRFYVHDMLPDMLES